jgi:hypothetical protein
MHEEQDECAELGAASNKFDVDRICVPLKYSALKKIKYQQY